jgi:hypothetical protein
MRVVLVSAALVAAAAAEARAAGPDLSVRAAPPARPHVPAMKMRRTAQATPAPAPGPGPAGSSIAPPADGGGGGGGDRFRDIEEKVVFKVSAGYALDSAPLSGAPMRNGVTPADAPADVSGLGGRELRSSNGYLLGDAVLGTRGVPMASLATYFQSQFRLSLDGASSFATMNDIWDPLGDEALLVHSAYAEIDGYGEPGTFTNHLFVRGGRQFHVGSTMLVSHFDGLSVAYEAPDWEVGGFFGRRVALWLGDDPGLVGGASARVRLQRMNGWPVDLAADYLEFDGESHVLELSGRARVKQATVTLTARALAAGDGFGVGRLGARVRWPWSSRLYLLADGDIIFAHDLSYDWLNPAPVDVVDVVDADAGTGLALPAPADAVRVGGGLMVRLPAGLEGYGFGRAHLAGAAGFDQTWFEVGGAVQAPLGRQLTAGAQLKLRLHQLDEDTRLEGSAFDDVSGSGVAGFKEASAEVRWRQPQKLGVAAGGYVRVYDVTTPYLETTNDARAGGRVDAELWLERRARVRFVGEVAQPSPTFAPDLDTMYSFRLLGEAAF